MRTERESISMKAVIGDCGQQMPKTTLTAAIKYRAFLAMDSWLSTAVTNSLTARLVAQQIGARVEKKKHKRHHSRYLSFCTMSTQHC